MEELLYLTTPVAILAVIISFIITWTLGLIPPLLIRYVILRRPIGKGLAIGISAIFWVLNFIIFVGFLESKNKTHFALILIAYVSYWILRREKKKTDYLPIIDSPSAATKNIPTDKIARGIKKEWRMKRSIIIGLSIVIVLILFFVWPTLYRYEHAFQGKLLVRINRFTGDAERLTVSGWYKMERPKPLTDDESNKMDALVKGEPVKQEGESSIEIEKKKHFEAIKQAHPDFNQIVDGGELERWIGEQPSSLKDYYKKVYEQGTAEQVINMVSEFKKSHTEKQVKPITELTDEELLNLDKALSAKPTSKP